MDVRRLAPSGSISYAAAATVITAVGVVVGITIGTASPAEAQSTLVIRGVIPAHTNPNITIGDDDRNVNFDLGGQPSQDTYIVSIEALDASARGPASTQARKMVATSSMRVGDRIPIDVKSVTESDGILYVTLTSP